jgi:hypothetical protein
MEAKQKEARKFADISALEQTVHTVPPFCTFVDKPNPAYETFDICPHTTTDSVACKHHANDRAAREIDQLAQLFVQKGGIKYTSRTANDHHA